MKHDHMLMVHKEWLPRRIFLMVVLVATITFFVFAPLITRYTHNQANSLVSSPSPEAIGKPQALNLAPPYIRLYTAKKMFRFGEKVPVDVYIQSGSFEVVETTLDLHFDDGVLQIEQDDVESTDIFKTVQTTLDEKNKLLVSLFVSPQAGHNLIVSPDETKIASLTFTVKSLEATTTNINLEFKKGNASQTAIIPSFSNHNVVNVLENVEGLSLEIIP